MLNDLYGDGWIHQSRVWFAFKKDLSPRFPDEYATILTVQTLVAQSYIQGNTRKAAVVTFLNPGGNSCHSCRPIIDAAIFTWKEDHWALGASPRGVVLAGDFG